MRTLLSRGLVLLALSLCASAQAAFPLKIEQGAASLTLEKVPARVVVYDPGVLDTLGVLGIAVAGAPTLNGPAYLKEALQAQQPVAVAVGTLFEPDYPALQALKPDLIIVGARSRGQQAKLAALAPTLDLSIDPAHFVDGTRANLRLLGQIFAREARADELDGELTKAIAAAQQKSHGLSSLTLFTVGDNIVVHAPGERFGMLQALLGTAAVLPQQAPSASAQERPEPGSPQAKAMREEQRERLHKALAAQPDWLIVLDRGAATGGDGQAQKTLAANPSVSTSQAWQQGRVFYLDAPTWYIATGGYQGLMQTLQRFTAEP